MKTIFAALFALIPVSAFPDQIWCSDQGSYPSGPLPDSAYSYRIEASDSNVYMPLVDRLYAFVTESPLEKNGISITIGKSGSPDATWSPIASTFGINEVTLRINRNALASHIFFDATDFPRKKY